MKVGDIVIPATGSGVILHCGSGRYTHAIVACLEPFSLISDEGDMLWVKENPSDYIALCQAHPKYLENTHVIKRLKEIDCEKFNS